MLAYLASNSGPNVKRPDAVSASYKRITSSIVYKTLKMTLRSALSDMHGAYLFWSRNDAHKLLMIKKKI